ncbi:hypothetical protein KR222_009923 [Zaprionus bogoriensis]|nr:hypothetical protein KR222_009923 [Zaprionus bogoriensis]
MNNTHQNYKLFANNQTNTQTNASTFSRSQQFPAQAGNRQSFAAPARFPFQLGGNNNNNNNSNSTQFQQGRPPLPARSWFNPNPQQIVAPATPQTALWRDSERASPDVSPARRGNSAGWFPFAGSKSSAPAPLGESSEQKRRRAMEQTSPSTDDFSPERRGVSPQHPLTAANRKRRHLFAPGSKSSEPGLLGEGPEQKRRRAVQTPPPPSSSTAARTPNIRQLPVSRILPYMRYIAQGYSADEALNMAKQPAQQAAKVANPPVEQQQQEAPAAAAAAAEERDEPAEPDLRVCFRPLDYPEKKLNHREKLQLEDAIFEQVQQCGAKGNVPPLCFDSVYFRSGYIELNCHTQETADWLLAIATDLPKYSGPPVEALLESSSTQKRHTIRLFLPRSAGKSNEFLLGLLRAQNEFNIDLWHLVSRVDLANGAVVIFNIDNESAADIVANGHKLFYRVSMVQVKGLEKLRPIKAKPTAAAPPPPPAKETPKPNSASEEVKAKSPERVPKLNPKPFSALEKNIVCIDLASDDEEAELSASGQKNSTVEKKSEENGDRLDEAKVLDAEPKPDEVQNLEEQKPDDEVMVMEIKDEQTREDSTVVNLENCANEDILFVDLESDSEVEETSANVEKTTTAESVVELEAKETDANKDEEMKDNAEIISEVEQKSVEEEQKKSEEMKPSEDTPAVESNELQETTEAAEAENLDKEKVVPERHEEQVKEHSSAEEPSPEAKKVVAEETTVPAESTEPKPSAVPEDCQSDIIE